MSDTNDLIGRMMRTAVADEPAQQHTEAEVLAKRSDFSKKLSDLLEREGMDEWSDQIVLALFVGSEVPKIRDGKKGVEFSGAFLGSRHGIDRFLTMIIDEYREILNAVLMRHMLSARHGDEDEDEEEETR